MGYREEFFVLWNTGKVCTSKNLCDTHLNTNNNPGLEFSRVLVAAFANLDLVA